MSLFSSDKREAELIAQIESLKAELESTRQLKANLQELTDKYTQLEGAYDRLHKSYERLSAASSASETATTPKPAPEPEPKTDETPRKNTEETPAPASESIDLTPVIERLDKLAELQADMSHKDNLIKDLHKEVQTLSRGTFDQFTKPFLNSIIRIYTHLAETVDSARREFYETNAKEAEILYKRLEPSLLMVEDTLQDEFDAIKFAPSPGDAYEPRAHHAIQSISTSDEALRGTVSACRQCGFKSAIDGRLLKPAVVIVYRFDEKK